MARVKAMRKRAPYAISALLVAGCGLFGSSSESSVDASAVTSGDGGGGSAPARDASPPRPDAPPVSALPARVRDTIRSEEFSRLVLEVDVVEGMAPREGVEAHLEELFAEILDKPDGIEAIRDDVLAPRGSDHAWSIEELRELAQESLNLEVDASTTVLHTLWVDGRSDRDGDGGVILGLQFGRHIVMFKETIDAVCSRAALPLNREQTCRGTERALWIHEIGHAIGLVDNGLPMVEDHKDPERGAHSRHADCIMYWAYTGEALADRVLSSILGDTPELGFDEYCLADIAAVRDAP
jgi:hypothetical protein